MGDLLKYECFDKVLKQKYMNKYSNKSQGIIEI